MHKQYQCATDHLTNLIMYVNLIRRQYGWISYTNTTFPRLPHSSNQRGVSTHCAPTAQLVNNFRFLSRGSSRCCSRWRHPTPQLCPTSTPDNLIIQRPASQALVANYETGPVHFPAYPVVGEVVWLLPRGRVIGGKHGLGGRGGWVVNRW